MRIVVRRVPGHLGCGVAPIRTSSATGSPPRVIVMVSPRSTMRMSSERWVFAWCVL